MKIECIDVRSRDDTVAVYFETPGDSDINKIVLPRLSFLDVLRIGFENYDMPSRVTMMKSDLQGKVRTSTYASGLIYTIMNFFGWRS